jgi:methionyl-tRNA formyltransferase
MDRVSNCTPGHGKIVDPVPELPATGHRLQQAEGTENNTWSMKHETWNRIKIVFFSSSIIGLPFLQGLVDDERFQIIWVVTPPGQPIGRGMEMKPNLIKSKSLELGINNIATPNTLRLDSKKHPDEGEKFQSWLQEIHPDYIVVMAYGKIIPQHILDIPSLGPINIHPSLLPHYRWPTPPQTTLLHGVTQTWISIMKMSAGLDEGDIINVLPLELELTTTFKDFIQIIEEQWPAFLNETLIQYAKGELEAKTQDHSKATFTNKIEKEDGLIDIFNESLEQIFRKYNAYYLWPKVYFVHQEKRVIIEDLKINKHNYESNKANPFANKEYNLNQAISNLTIKPEGKKTMNWEDWKRGSLRK